ELWNRANGLYGSFDYAVVPCPAVAIASKLFCKYISRKHSALQIQISFPTRVKSILSRLYYITYART
ncbi:hypothetical protein PMAYCL1PPCAC_03480, partial [Pristionchus mayeri]